MGETENSIKNNIEQIWKRIDNALARSGRQDDEVTVVAVSKTVGPEMVLKAACNGIINFGENRVQELCQKYDIIKKDVNWHLIGHLQTNKVKYIIDKVKLIHSVDSVQLAREIQNRAQKAGRIVDILIQLNVSGEDTKFGANPEIVMQLLKSINTYPNIKVKGLMTIGPFTEDSEAVRLVFRELKKIFIDIKKENIDNIDMTYLSMGMSNDFEVAIEEGSNIVRIGTAIFGSRK